MKRKTSIIIELGSLILLIASCGANVTSSESSFLPSSEISSEILSSSEIVSSSELSSEEIDDGKGIYFVNGDKETKILQEEDVLSIKTTGDLYNLSTLLLATVAKNEIANPDSYLFKGEVKPQSYNDIDANAEEFVNNIKDRAVAMASYTGVTYEQAFQSALSYYGVKDEAGLKDFAFNKYTVDSIINWYILSNGDELVKELTSLDSKVSFASYPYHMRHALIQLDNLNTISSEEVACLYQLVDSLRWGTSLDNLKNDDPGSASNHQSLGIMNTTTSFVSEFKLGTYVFDTLLLHKDTPEALSVEEGLGLDKDELLIPSLQEEAITYVPYKIFSQMEKYKDINSLNNDFELKDGEEEETYYPRNIYYNKYLNRRGIFLITNDMAAESKDSNLSIFSDKAAKDFSATDYDSSIQKAEAGKSGFRYVKGISRDNSHLILTDENGRPIFASRSDYGIHFMITEESIYDEDIIDYYSLDISKEGRTYLHFIETTDTNVIQSKRNEIYTNIYNYLSTSLISRAYDLLLKNNTSFSVKCTVDNFDLENNLIVLAKYIQDVNSKETASRLENTWKNYLNLITTNNSNLIANTPDERTIFEVLPE